MVTKITIDAFFSDYQHLPLIDVRSPGEFLHGHWITAHNIPLFDNEERAHIGTVYKQQSREKAIELGYKYVTPKLDYYIEESLKVAPSKTVVVHCWRGGMRSQSFARHLSENGFDQVYVIEGGYKSFRRKVLDFFEQELLLLILGGYTGSGKTDIIDELRKSGQQVVDLESIANHQGSAFGGIGKGKQPSVEVFENKLFAEFQKLDIQKPIWLEDESMNIGKIFIPQKLFRQMRNTRVYFLNIPVEERALYLMKDYGLQNKEELGNAILKLTKRLGHEAQNKAMALLAEGNLFEVALIMLKYYDKAYEKGVSMRDQEKVIKLECTKVNARENTQKIIRTAFNW